MHWPRCIDLRVYGVYERASQSPRAECAALRRFQGHFFSVDQRVGWILDDSVARIEAADDLHIGAVIFTNAYRNEMRDSSIAAFGDGRDLYSFPAKDEGGCGHDERGSGRVGFEVNL